MSKTGKESSMKLHLLMRIRGSMHILVKTTTGTATQSGIREFGIQERKWEVPIPRQAIFEYRIVEWSVCEEWDGCVSADVVGACSIAHGDASTHTPLLLSPPLISPPRTLHLSPCTPAPSLFSPLSHPSCPVLLFHLHHSLHTWQHCCGTSCYYSSLLCHIVLTVLFFCSVFIFGFLL